MVKEKINSIYMADIQIILGSMFSGKSTELVKRCNKFKAIKKKVLYVNHLNDIRCQEEIKTHDNLKQNAKKVKNLLEIDMNDVDVIGIDEAQFFGDLDLFVKKYELNDITIIIAGLDGDSERNKFGKILDIIPYCNSVTKLHALCTICKNGESGIFSLKKIKNDHQIDIGDEDKYIAVCRKHYSGNLKV